MQNRRHFGGQTTGQSIRMTQCTAKSSVKRVQPENDNSNDTIGEQQKCNITFQNNATNLLDALDPNLKRCGHASLHDERSNDYLEVYLYLLILVGTDAGRVQRKRDRYCNTISD